jgi:hypothetical protein
VVNVKELPEPGVVVKLGRIVGVGVLVPVAEVGMGVSVGTTPAVVCTTS